MSTSRREFIKIGLQAAAGMALSLRLGNAKAADFDLDFSSLLDMIDFVSPDSGTLQYRVGSPCCTFCFHKLKVWHYQPVAFVEVIRSGSDSIFGGAPFSPSATKLTDGKWQHGFDVRVWDLPQIIIDIAFGFQACRLCGKPGGNITDAAGMINADALAGMAGLACSSPITAVADALKNQLRGIMSQLISQFPVVDCIPQILYDSSADPHWLTGCRDIGMAELFSMLCEVPGMGQSLSVEDAVSLNPFNPCVGAWGSVLPRQYRVENHDEQTAAALTAYRGIHVAANTWQTFPYDATVRGKLQQTVPNAVQGYSPGTNKVTYNLSRLTPVDGKWVFTWWVPVRCCKRVTDIWGACVPRPPCMPGMGSF